MNSSVVKVMTLAADEFIRRFLIHVLPTGFHRICHYGLFVNNRREQNITQARQLLNAPAPKSHPVATNNVAPDDDKALPQPCPCCGGRMIVIEIFARGTSPRHHPTQPTCTIRLDTS